MLRGITEPLGQPMPSPQAQAEARRGGLKLGGVPKHLVLSSFCLPFLSLYQVQIAKLWGHREQGGLSQPHSSPVSCSQQQLSSYHFLDAVKITTHTLLKTPTALR